MRIYQSLADLLYLLYFSVLAVFQMNKIIITLTIIGVGTFEMRTTCLSIQNTKAFELNIIAVTRQWPAPSGYYDFYAVFTRKFNDNKQVCTTNNYKKVYFFDLFCYCHEILLGAEAVLIDVVGEMATFLSLLLLNIFFSAYNSYSFILIYISSLKFESSQIYLVWWKVYFLLGQQE